MGELNKYKEDVQYTNDYNKLIGIIIVNRLGYIDYNDGIYFKGRKFKRFLKNMLKNNRIITSNKEYFDSWNIKNPITVYRNNVKIKDNDIIIGDEVLFTKLHNQLTDLYIISINDKTIGNIILPQLNKLSKNCGVKHYFFD